MYIHCMEPLTSAIHPWKEVVTIQKDIKAHLDLVMKYWINCSSLMQLPLLEGLKFKNQNFREAIDINMQAEDEVQDQ